MHAFSEAIASGLTLLDDILVDRLSSEQLIKIGVIVQAACRKQLAPSLNKKKRSKRSSQGVLEIIDPEPDDSLRQSSMSILSQENTGIMLRLLYLQDCHK